MGILLKKCPIIQYVLPQTKKISRTFKIRSTVVFLSPKEIELRERKRGGESEREKERERERVRESESEKGKGK